VRRTTGIEIEMIGVGCPRIAVVVNGVLNGRLEVANNPSDPTELVWEISVADGSTWTVLDDDSLRAPVASRGELVTPPLREFELPLVATVAAALRDAGASVNESCGLHVHVGIAGCRVEHLNRLVDLVEGWEPAVLDRVLPSRRQFSGPLDPGFMARFRARQPTTLDEFWALWYGDAGWHSRRDRYDPVRYRGLNLHSFRRLGTVEFRYFNGTIDPEQILDHVRSCLALVEQAGFPEPEEDV
jgi:hypothetical protein